MRYFEDLEIGAETHFGSYEVTREEVLDFARKYDPQPFHLSDEEAAKTHFGRLAASGWHTCAMTMAVIAQVCQPLAASRPKWVFAAASSDKWKGWGSYLRANSSTSSRVTS